MPGLAWMRVLPIVIAILFAATAARAESAGVVLRPSLGEDIDAWPFGFALTAGLWLERGALLGGAHVRGGMIRSHFDPQVGRDYAALVGSYGAQIGVTLPLGDVRPYLLVGYELLGTELSANTGESLFGPVIPGGRSGQDVTAEAGVRFATRVGVALLLGVRGSFAAVPSSPNALGPPLPRAAAAMTVLF